MDLLNALALVLFTLGGYSSGAILAQGSKKVAPELTDLSVLVILWGAALMTRSMLGKWLAILIWFFGSMAMATVLTRLRWGRFPVAKVEIKSPITPVQQLWRGWKHFAAEMGNYQSRMLLALFYFVVVTPFGLGVRLFSDPLHLRPQQGNSLWGKRPPLNENLDAAHEQS